MRKISGLALAVILLGGLAYAQSGSPEILSRKESVFINKDCKKNNTCDLKKVEYYVEDYRVTLSEGGSNYGTRFFARYETKKVKHLDDFIFVNFIKGCRFASSLSSGQVLIDRHIVFRRDNTSEINNFKDWTIDSYDYDPAYSTFSGESRHYNYKWNTVADSFAKDTEKLFVFEKPRTPKLYISDRPGTAYLMNNQAKNVSLRFKTCIYKAKDVPNLVTHDNLNFAEPVSCYEWNSSFIYNHSTGEFESPGEIVDVCR